MSKWKVPEGVKVTDGIIKLISGCLEKIHSKRWDIDQLIGQM